MFPIDYGCRVRGSLPQITQSYTDVGAGDAVLGIILGFAYNCELISFELVYELRVPRSGTYIMKPTASCEAAQLWVQYDTPPLSFPGGGLTHPV